jgi:hypothetical protein
VQEDGLAGYLLGNLRLSYQYKRDGYVMVYRLWGGKGTLYGGPNCAGKGSCWSTENMASASNYNLDRARDRYAVFPEWNSFQYMAQGWVHRNNIISSTTVDGLGPYGGGGNETSIRDAAHTIMGVTSNKVGWCKPPLCF